MKQIRYSKQAAKALKAMQRDTASRILSAVNAYALGKAVDVKKMAGSSYFRIRSGKWRIVLDDQGLIVLIVKIGPRGDVYKGR